MVTPESELRRVITAALEKAGDRGLSVAAIYAVVENSCHLTAEDMQPPMLHEKPVAEPRWKRNVRNTLQSDKNRLRVSNYKKGWWRVASGPEPGRALNVHTAWAVVHDAALKAAAAGTEFQSPVKKRRYCIGSVETTTIEVVCLEPGKPAWLGQKAVARAVSHLNAAGSITGTGTLINTAALETAFVVLHPGINWSPDGRSILAEGLGTSLDTDLFELEEEADILHIIGTEGVIRLQQHRRRERDAVLMRKFKHRYMQENAGAAPCQVCGFDFTAVYGEMGRSYIEAHHRTPLSTVNPTSGTTTVYEDMAFLCANCHRMAHRVVDSRWLTVEELAQRVK